MSDRAIFSRFGRTSDRERRRIDDALRRRMLTGFRSYVQATVNGVTTARETWMIAEPIDSRLEALLGRCGLRRD